MVASQPDRTESSLPEFAKQSVARIEPAVFLVRQVRSAARDAEQFTEPAAGIELGEFDLLRLRGGERRVAGVREGGFHISPRSRFQCFAFRFGDNSFANKTLRKRFVAVDGPIGGRAGELPIRRLARSQRFGGEGDVLVELRQIRRIGAVVALRKIHRGGVVGRRRVGEPGFGGGVDFVRL